MPGLMVYGVVLGVFIAAATHFIDVGLRALGRPTRWIWTLGMAASVAAVLGSAAWNSPTPPSPQESVVPVSALYELLAGGANLQHASAPSPRPLDGPLTLLWILGSGALVAAALWAGSRLRRARAGWERRSLGSQEVLVSEGLGPAVLGLLRPVIVVPPWVLDLSREKQEMILLHEKEHQGARDPALLVLALAFVAAAPWNPALWWMTRRLHLAVEGDCDARVLARGVPAKRYGNLLLEVASGGRRMSALTPALAEGGETFLERRLLMIRSAVGKKGVLAAALPFLLGAGFILLACETPTPPASTEAELPTETGEAQALESSAAPASVPTEVSEGEDGYFLVRKDAGKVEYVGPVSEDQLRLIEERDDEAADRSFLVRGSPEAASASDGPGYVKVRGLEETEGTITIRGSGSGKGEAGPKPLIIVDGVIVSDPNFMETMDKGDIDRIEVIKGAAAAELYGERAAGGVVKIFTKK